MIIPQTATYAIKSSFKPVTFSTEAILNRLSKQYKENSLTQSGKTQLVIPSPLSLTTAEGFYVVTKKSSIFADLRFSKEKAYLIDFLKKNNGIELLQNAKAKKKSDIKILYDKSFEDEAYELVVKKGGISIIAGNATGAFYAIQTVISLSPANSWGKSLDRFQIPSVSIKDKPRFGYRGLMLDVARNFQSKESVKKIIDVMAMYKLNTLHFHLNDDEGWRIEIPKLPELTEVGSVRNGTYLKGESLQPAYGSGAVAKNSQFYTVDDFQEILKYANERHISVIPELETPGHARAAIKSMKARYLKYKSLGNHAEAVKYLLHDEADESQYSSAQNWDDNVMNVAMPSVYSFISVVLDELKSIYQEVGIPLKKVSLGGDEVPRGAWEKSAKIQQLRDSLNFSSVHQVWPYYIQKIADMCKSKGLLLAGWEEMGMVNNGNGMETNPALSNHNIQLDVWNNLIGGGQEDLAYKLANAGYKVVITSANNFYFDLAWNDDFKEPGHNWAGLTDVKKTYSFLPENYFTNIFNDNDGNALSPEYFDKKQRLTEKGKANIVGVKGAIWTEKVNSQERLEYMLFPRVLAMAERAWAPKPVWETSDKFDKKAFLEDYDSFIQKLGTQELQKLNTLNDGYSYRLPTLGLKLDQDYILCNTEYPGFDVFYTTDGTDPLLTSNKITTAIPLDKAQTYKFRILTKTGRAGKTVTLNFEKHGNKKN